MTMGFEIQGRLRLADDLRRMRSQLSATVSRELDRGMLLVEARSKPVTPKGKTGFLRAHTFTAPSRAVKGRVRAGIYNNLSYAAYVHERQDPYVGWETVRTGRGGPRMRMPVMRNVRWSVPGTGPKFIEAPFMTTVPEIQLAVERAVRALAGGDR
jgi:hypothetical protein